MDLLGSLLFRVAMPMLFSEGTSREIRLESSTVDVHIDLSKPPEDAIRVSLIEECQLRHLRYVGFWKPILEEIRGASSAVSSPAASGFRAATFQWRDEDLQQRDSCSYVLKGYDFLTSLTFNLDPASVMNHIKRESLAMFNGRQTLPWARTARRLQLTSDGELDGVLRVVIRCEAHTAMELAKKLEESPASSAAIARRFVAEVRQLAALYRPHMTRRNLKPIVLLLLHHANLNVFADFLQSFETTYAAPRMDMFDPQQAELRRWNLKALVADAQLCRRFASVGAELIATAESLLDLVLALEGNNDDDNDDPPPAAAAAATAAGAAADGDGDGDGSGIPQAPLLPLPALGAELRGCSRDVVTRLDRLTGDLDRSLQLLSLSRDMAQSGNVQLLTLLATVFLPLSLAAGVLSMQSRFRDLGALLYDFFGVVVLLAALVAVFLAAVFLVSAVAEVESRLWRWRSYKTSVRPVLLATLAVMTLVIGALVLASFVVGMFKDVTLGAEILGYGVLAATVGPVALFATVLAVAWIPELLMRAYNDMWKKREGPEHDVEEDLGGGGGSGNEQKGKTAAAKTPVDSGVRVPDNPVASGSLAS